MKGLIVFLITTLCVMVSCQKVEMETLSQGIDSETVVGDDKEFPMPEDPRFHLVALRDTTIERGKVYVTYVSWKEWDGVMSSFSINNTQAVRLAKSYVEGDLTGWKVPTFDDVYRLKEVYGDIDSLNNFNDWILSKGGKPLECKLQSGSNKRFLCANGDSTYSFTPGSSVLKAGATVKYYLRLIKDTVITRHLLETDDTISFTF